MVRQARCSHILVDSYEQALDLQRRVYAGENFATLAAQYSKCPSGRNGGDLGWFGRGQMVKPFEDAAFSYNPGDMTIVQTQFGWHRSEMKKQTGRTRLYPLFSILSIATSMMPFLRAPIMVR